MLHKASIPVDNCGDVDGMIVERKKRCTEKGVRIHLNIAAGQYSLKLLNEISMGH